MEKPTTVASVDTEVIPRFTIDLPKGWVDQTAYLFAGPEEGGMHHQIVLMIDRNPQFDDAHSFGRDRVDQLSIDLPDMEVVKEEMKEYSAGEGYDVVFRWQQSDDRVVFRKFVYFVLGGIAYTFSVDFSKRTRKTVGLEVERIINSFTPIDR
ncbi:MAG: hypothetical protein ACE5FH_02460 [Candidatus Zixiibacteriota bacterium]